jgi:hypothetical protein
VHELHVLEEEGDVVVVMKLTRGVSVKKADEWGPLVSGSARAYTEGEPGRLGLLGRTKRKGEGGSLLSE